MLRALPLLALTGCVGTWDFPSTMQVRDPGPRSTEVGARLTGSAAHETRCLIAVPESEQKGPYRPPVREGCKEPLPPGVTTLAVAPLDLGGPLQITVPSDRSVDLELTKPTAANRVFTTAAGASLFTTAGALVPIAVGYFGKTDDAYTVAAAMLAAGTVSFSVSHVLAETIGPGRIRYRDSVTGTLRPDERSVELGTASNVALTAAGLAATGLAVGLLTADFPNVDTRGERLQQNLMGTALFGLAGIPFSFILANVLHAKDRGR